MDWEAIGAASGTVAAVAVCVTLIFLTVQLRQSNKSQKTAAYQTYIDARTALQVSLLSRRQTRHCWGRRSLLSRAPTSSFRTITRFCICR